MREQHVPGLVYGVVVDGKLARVRAFGVRDVASGAPVTPDTAFRIASMSKQFTALATLRLRDAGRVSLDAPAEKYIPEMRKWHYPTSDSPRITVRDLLSHAAGFVTDDPWGDRQLDMSEADFTRFVADGVPFSRAPGMAYEYSNFGFALAGRVVTNTARTNYAEYITEQLLQATRHAAHGVGHRQRSGAQRAHRLSLGKRRLGRGTGAGPGRLWRHGRTHHHGQRLRALRRVAARRLATARRRRGRNTAAFQCARDHAAGKLLRACSHRAIRRVARAARPTASE